MPLPTDNPRLSDYVAVGRRRWRAIAVVVALVLLAAVTYAVARPAPQEATALISLTVPEGSPPVDPQLELAVLESPQVEAAVEERLGFLPDAQAARVGDSPVLSVTVAAASAEKAAESANAFADAYIEQRNARELARLLAGQESLTERLDEVRAAATTTGGPEVDPEALRELRLAADLLADAATSGRLAAVEAAAAELREAAGGAVGTEAALALVRRARLQQLLDDVAVAVDTVTTSGPQLVVQADSSATETAGGLARVIPVALVIGLLVGAFVALARELSDRRVRETRDLRREDDLPVLTVTPSGAGLDALRGSLVLGLPEGGLVQIAQVAGEDASGPVAELLQGSLERGDRRVRVVDVSSPEAAHAHGLAAVTGPGVADALRDGRVPGDFVLVTSGPVGEHGDGLVLAGAVDGLVLVVQVGLDARDDVHRAERLLRSCGARLLATVLLERQPVEAS
jgi:succinoglycan biosynthesis transport protein ExoP